MGYECIKCCSPTDNDSDVCDDCEEEARKEYLLGLEWETKQQKAEIERLRAALGGLTGRILVENMLPPEVRTKWKPELDAAYAALNKS